MKKRKFYISEKVIKTFALTPNYFTVGPFTATCDTFVPIYPDSRKTFSDPKRLKILAREIIKFIKKKKIKFDIIFGGASAGIPIAIAVGLLMNKPCGFVRKEAKEGGMGLAVEGSYKKGQTAIIIDDAAGHGAAKSKFIKNIRKAGLKIKWVIVCLSRTHTNSKYTKWIDKAKVNFQSFADIRDLTRYCLKNNIITKEAAQLLKWYEEDSTGWHHNKKKYQFFLDYKKQKRRKSKTGV